MNRRTFIEAFTLGAIAASAVAITSRYVKAASDDLAADVALILAVDVSGSVDATERMIQRRGYAEAIQHPDVLRAIADGAYGRIIVTVFEWSDLADQEVRVPWTVVASPIDAARVAGQIMDGDGHLAHSSTSIAGAMSKAAELFDACPLPAERWVLDVSGDGKDYQHTTLLRPARAALLAKGVTINGLPILSTPDAKDLVQFYSEEVAGGPGSFVLPAKSYADLGPVLIQKLRMEIA